MICAINVGNTHIALGIKNGSNVKNIKKYNTKDFDNYTATGIILKDYFKNIKLERLEAIVISSVVPELNDTISKELVRCTGIEPVKLDISHFVKIGFDFSNYKRDEVGLDRLASSYFVSRNYDLPAIVLDFGTAITMNVIGNSGQFLGGFIIPGIFLWIESLSKNTACLPDEITLSDVETCIGSNTLECVSIGALQGIGTLTDGMLERVASEVGAIKTVVATGGGAEYILPYCRKQILFEENLLLAAISSVYEQ